MPRSVNISPTRRIFVGAIRLPSDAFKREGTAVVTDIIFLRKRTKDELASLIDPDWLAVAPVSIDGVEIPINRYFHNHPEMVLGTPSLKNTLYHGEGYSLAANGELSAQLQEAIGRLPRLDAPNPRLPEQPRAPSFTPAAARTPHQ